MALSQRSASRFYAAFYRWSRHTRQPRQCALATIHDHRSNLPSRTTARNYHATGLLRQQEQHQIQDKGLSSDPQSDGNSSGARLTDQAESRIPISNLDAPQDEPIPIEVDEPEVEAAKLKNDVRRLMRNVPTSVAVVTVASYDSELKAQVPMGVAVSSLSSVTLDPPTISFNLKHPSKTLDAIRAAKGLFRVHFPSADRGGASMVEHFCRGNHPDAYVARTKALRLFVPKPDSQPDKSQASVSLAPQLLGDSVRASIECTLTQELLVEDHVILVARVDSLVGRTLGDQRDRTVIYVDGMYLRHNGTRISPHDGRVVFTEDAWSVWDYPLFPGEEHRQDYADRIKATVKQNPKALQLSKESLRDLEATLALAPGALGINLESLVKECRREAGLPSVRKGDSSAPIVLSEFWGRITPGDKAKIIDRAKAIARVDPRFLSLNYRLFLQLLGVNTASIGLLPSDFMEPLRQEGLAAPFQARTGYSAPNTAGHSVQYLEQVEHRLRQYFAEQGYQNASATRLDDVVQTFGEARLVASYFKKSRARLHADASPELFISPNIDIFNEVSSEEARVVMSRIVKFMEVNNFSAFRKRLNFDPNEVLRRVKVHPSITGFNVEFFFGKLRNLAFSTQYSRDLPGLVDRMLEAWFTNTISWDDLGNRVKDFVQKSPMRVMTWSPRDIMAAIGLSWETTLNVAVSDTPQPLNRGQIIETLVAKELKSLHGKGSKELDDAIAQHLKSTYNYDIQTRHSQYTPVEEDSLTSGDILEEARKANRAVDVYGASLKRAKGWEERGATDESRSSSASKLNARGFDKQGSRGGRQGRSTPYMSRNPLRNTSSWKSFKAGDGQE
ncbi:flavin reductase like domain-containing protein [Paraphoma chrysanthemicola]|uniref:Flavin reductase like domain-containing protein n=1 Tax=Paraphoma chrysanthemicola TaxID=798071 RepID=A0A8K0RHS3_9PLEO|nr:flavin reductase like domain-containing protein [Paraphoma chrysanthemicola]